MKRHLAIIIILALILFVGCGGGSGGSDVSPSPSPTETGSSSGSSSSGSSSSGSSSSGSSSSSSSASSSSSSSSGGGTGLYIDWQGSSNGEYVFDSQNYFRFDVGTGVLVHGQSAPLYYPACYLAKTDGKYPADVYLDGNLIGAVNLVKYNIGSPQTTMILHKIVGQGIYIVKLNRSGNEIKAQLTTQMPEEIVEGY